MTERSNWFTDAEDSNTEATSGSRTTAVRPCNAAANRFGRAFR